MNVAIGGGASGIATSSKEVVKVSQAQKQTSKCKIDQGQPSTMVTRSKTNAAKQLKGNTRSARDFIRLNRTSVPNKQNERIR